MFDLNYKLDVIGASLLALAKSILSLCRVNGTRFCLHYLKVKKIRIFTGLPGKPSHKMGFRSSVSKSGHPGEGKHEGLVRRNDVLTNGFIGFSLA